MKAIKTRYNKIQQKINSLNVALTKMRCDKKRMEDELERYIRRHKSLKFDGLETGDTKSLGAIYRYFDERYPIEWQGGLRCDTRGMRLFFWVDDDPDFLIFHLSSTSNNPCFGGSTSWIVKAATLDDKVSVITQVKKDIQKILKGGGR
jgi:hypothetical protein